MMGTSIPSDELIITKDLNSILVLENVYAYKYVDESAIKNIDDPSSYGAFSREWVWYKTTTSRIPEQRHQQLGNALVNYFQLVF